ncbi:hypothetical protein [Ideonella alba]|uniref:Uncharacterized protein n=1 Tax=Ideonella alba TaxID=2824118 RepID=A0A941BDF8_9BURK|nr:hypothetical protein [Ideonella alba]MBQ0928862.1 hypothetical protein [Ideonella alba]
MSAPTRPSLWNRLFARSSAPRTEDDEDAAGLGTAFGLDYVLDEVKVPMPWQVADEAARPPPV